MIRELRLKVFYRMTHKQTENFKSTQKLIIEAHRLINFIFTNFKGKSNICLCKIQAVVGVVYRESLS